MKLSRPFHRFEPSSKRTAIAGKPDAAADGFAALAISRWAWQTGGIAGASQLDRPEQEPGGPQSIAQNLVLIAPNIMLVILRLKPTRPASNLGGDPDVAGRNRDGRRANDREVKAYCRKISRRAL